MSKYVFHTAMYFIDPIYPDILDKHLGQIYECKYPPRDVADNMINIDSPCGFTSIAPYTYNAPSDAGIKITSKSFNTYVNIEVHLETYGNKSVLITPEMRLWHTSKLRKYDLEYMHLGLNNGYNQMGSIGLIIPPREPRFAVRSVVDMNIFKHVFICNYFVKY